MPTDPRIAVLSALSSPGWHPVPEAHGMPWDEAEQLLTAYDASRAAAAPSVPSAPADRQERYAVAIHDAMEEDLSLIDEDPVVQAVVARAAEAAMALADAEQAADLVIALRGAGAERDKIEAKRYRQERAAALRDAANQYATLADQNEAYDAEQGALDHDSRLQHGTVRDIAIGLRRMADEIEAASGPSRVAGEAQQPETQAEAQGALLATRCDACRHTLNWHRNDVGCTVVLCVCGRFQAPVDDEQPS
jgi:hypothetical protein